MSAERIVGIVFLAKAMKRPLVKINREIFYVKSYKYKYSKEVAEMAIVRNTAYAGEAN